MNKKGQLFVLEIILKTILAISMVLFVFWLVLQVYEWGFGSSNDLSDETFTEFVNTLTTIKEGEVKNLKELILGEKDFVYVVSADAEATVFIRSNTGTLIPSSEPFTYFVFQKPLDRCPLEQACACHCDEGYGQSQITWKGKSAVSMTCEKLLCQPLGKEISFPEKTSSYMYYYAQENPSLDQSSFEEGYSFVREFSSDAPETFLTLERYKNTIFFCEGPLKCVPNEMKQQLDEQELTRTQDQAIAIYTKFAQDAKSCLANLQCNEVIMEPLPANYRIGHYDNELVIAQKKERGWQPLSVEDIPLPSCQTRIIETYEPLISHIAVINRNGAVPCVQQKVEV